MRLRYLRLQELPPLQDVRVVFGHESLLGRSCAIHFVVGVNGTGKSRLLQAVAETFLSLERPRVPPFPVTLAFDLGTGQEARTIYLRHVRQSGEVTALVESQAVLLEFERTIEDEAVEDWDALPEQLDAQRGNLPPAQTYKGDTLPRRIPRVLLAYTSGAIRPWEQIFSASSEGDADLSVARPDPMVERPAGWTRQQEREEEQRRQAEAGERQEAPPLSDDEDGAELRTASIGLFVSRSALKLALCAVALDQAQRDFRDYPTEAEQRVFVARIERTEVEGKRMAGLRGLLNAVDWLWPVALSLRINFRPDRMTRDQTAQLRGLYKVASAVIREPDPGMGRQVVFDLRRPLPDSLAIEDEEVSPLLEMLRGTAVTPFSVFQQLYQWERSGLLEDVTLAVKKRNVDDLLLYDWLSDGEQVFLGRMALFHLLQGEDDALILLDEPETHFNDVWKREIVDIIDDSLRNNTSDVVISTHSSIALTDVFDTEITLLRKDEAEGTVAAVRTPIRTFGASPSEIMRYVFQASDTIGERAAEYLNLVLAATLYPAETEAVWSLDGDDAAVRNSPEFARLESFVRALPQYADDEGDLASRLIQELRALRGYVVEQTRESTVTVADAVDLLEDRIGRGHYQFELRRRLMRLRPEEDDAPQN